MTTEEQLADPTVPLIPNKPQRTNEELKESLVVCTARRAQLKMAKKSMDKQYNEDIADTEEEIAGIMEQLG